MKWFKHYSNASDSLKLNHLIDELGLEGYGRYWLLLELLAQDFDGINDEFEIHFRKISSKLQIKFSKKLETFLQKLQDFSLIEYRVKEKVYFLKSPILLELQGRDFKKARTLRAVTAPKIKNKIKEIDKDKESYTLTNFLSPEKVTDSYNRILGGVGKLKTAPFGTLCNGQALSDFEISSGFLTTIEDWENLFQDVKTKSKLIGTHPSFNCLANILWLVKHDNIKKIQIGSFDNDHSDADMDDLGRRLGAI
ncbi:MAG: DUF4373 domain-containing protein [Flavobacteriaceae bacterium]|nr:DUF4373 domain-containing protein [Flavobacteriaceae bacterium]